MIANLQEKGFAVIENILHENELIELADSIGERVLHPEADENGVMRIYPDKTRVKGLAGFTYTRKAIPLHTDGPGVTNYNSYDGPADFILLWYTQKKSVEGSLVLSDGARIYRALQKEHPEILDYLHKEESGNFHTEPNHNYKGAVIQTTNNKSIRFKSISTANPIQNKKALQIFVDMSKKYAFTINTLEHQVIIIDNKRMLHGRTKLDAHINREVYHLLVYQQPNKLLGTYKPGFSE